MVSNPLTGNTSAPRMLGTSGTPRRPQRSAPHGACPHASSTRSSSAPALLQAEHQQPSLWAVVLAFPAPSGSLNALLHSCITNIIIASTIILITSCCAACTKMLRLTACRMGCCAHVVESSAPEAQSGRQDAADLESLRQCAHMLACAAPIVEKEEKQRCILAGSEGRSTRLLRPSQCKYHLPWCSQ